MSTKLAIAINLNDLEALICEYVQTLEPHARLTTQLTFSMFVLWLRKRQETTNAMKSLNRDDL